MEVQSSGSNGSRPETRKRKSAEVQTTTTPARKPSSVSYEDLALTSMVKPFYFFITTLWYSEWRIRYMFCERTDGIYVIMECCHVSSNLICCALYRPCICLIVGSISSPLTTRSGSQGRSLMHSGIWRGIVLSGCIQMYPGQILLVCHVQHLTSECHSSCGFHTRCGGRSSDANEAMWWLRVASTSLCVRWVLGENQCIIFPSILIDASLIMTLYLRCWMLISTIWWPQRR